MFLSMNLDHQLFVSMVTLLFLFWDLIKAMGEVVGDMGDG